MYRLKWFILLLVLYITVGIYVHVDAKDKGTTVKIDCKGFDLKYDFTPDQNNTGTPAAERVLFQGSDGTGTSLFRREQPFNISNQAISGKLKADWTTQPTANPLKFEMISEQGNGLSEEVIFSSIDTCKKLTTSTPTPTPNPGKPDLFVTAAARTSPMTQSSVDDWGYFLTFGNRGTNLAKAPITITDTLPSTITLDSDISANTSLNCTSSGQVITCVYPYDMLPDGNIFEIDFRVKTSQIGTFVNTATIVSNTPDQNLADNTANDNITVVGPPDLQLVISDASIPQDSDGSFTATISNIGQYSTSYPSEFTYKVPVNVQETSIDAPDWACQFDSGSLIMDCFHNAMLAPGSQTTIQVNVHAVSASVNTSEGSVSVPGDADYSNNNFTNTITVTDP